MAQIKSMDMIPEEELKNMNEELNQGAFIEDDDNSSETEVETREEEVEEKTTLKKSTASKKPTQTKKQTIPSNVEATTEDNAMKFLDNISIDVSKIDIVESTEMQKFENLDFVLNGKSTYQVTAAQSCYQAFMEPLKMSDINAITNSSLDVYQARMKLYQTIYSKINSTSLGKITFKDWLKITSYFDLPTLLYGIYMQTFPGSTDFTITCRHCEKTMDVKINNDTLISAKDEEVFKQFEKVVRNAKTPDEALEHSLVNKTERIVLPKSKIIMDVQTPSLANHLDLLSSADPKKISEVEDILTILLFLKKVYILDVKASMKANSAKYFEIKTRNEMVNVIRKLSIEDYKELNRVMAERINKYAIEYKIKDFPCHNCGKEVGDIPIDVETLLFQQILQL